ncbi:alpha/beta fold hydrolase [Arthrobacter sp. TMT4-20]
MSVSPPADKQQVLSASAAPEWLLAALTTTPATAQVTVEDAVVQYRSWGDPADQSVVLVHGGLAHASWWDHIAPLLSGHHVVAVDLSGHGDSTHRPSYDVEQWARELIAVIDHANLSSPVIIGHSMGGLPAVAAAIQLDGRASGVMTIDVRFNDEAWPVRVRESRRYDSIDAAAADFSPVRTRSELPIDPHLLRHLAETSLIHDSGAWRWKRADRYDIRRTPLRTLLPQLRTPIVLIRSDHGLLTAEAAAEMLELTPAPGIDVVVPASSHNPMLEQPIAFVGVIRALLATWRPWDGTGLRQGPDSPLSSATK